MTATRFQLLRSIAARLLKQARPSVFPEEELLNTIRSVTDLTEAEFQTVLQRMEHAKQVDRVVTEFEGTKTKLTDLGEHELCKS